MRRGRAALPGLLLGGLASIGLAVPRPARAVTTPVVQQAAEDVAPAADDDAEDEESTAGFVLPASAELAPPLVFMGYVDVGYAAAEGDGTSYPRADTRLPADYGVDTFAPAVNSRGEVASTDPRGLFINGFVPRSVQTAGHPSFLLNTVNFDTRYQPPHTPIMVFTRVQLLPRWGGRGRATRPRSSSIRRSGG